MTACNLEFVQVSTHSRPKAAGRRSDGLCPCVSFNTQPPEGGCFAVLAFYITPVVSTHSRPKAAEPVIRCVADTEMFQHTAARRRLPRTSILLSWYGNVSTHSRPKAAGPGYPSFSRKCRVSTHSRPKAADNMLNGVLLCRGVVSTHSRPKAAVRRSIVIVQNACVSTHSRPKAAGFAAGNNGHTS